jgi:threonine/homoserine/homoserine lactone efflux protein
LSVICFTNTENRELKTNNMNIILPFLSGFLAAIIGIFPPGLINMTAAKVSLNDGKRSALLFVLGALLVIVFQTYLSVLFARYINYHQEIVVVMREIGLGIFVIVTFYFFFFAKKPKTDSQKKHQLKSKKSRFFLGMLIASLNVFPIPYYVFISITLASFHVFTFDAISVYSLVFGVLMGSLLGFYFYVIFFNRMKTKTTFLINNMNMIIGTVTGIVSLLTLVNILNYYF